MITVMYHGEESIRSLTLQYRPDMTVRDAMALLSIEYDDVGLIAVNKKHERSDYVLADGDSIDLYPAALGG